MLPIDWGSGPGYGQTLRKQTCTVREQTFPYNQSNLRR